MNWHKNFERNCVVHDWILMMENYLINYAEDFNISTVLKLTCHEVKSAATAQ
jgi:hypothetical protein